MIHNLHFGLFSDWNINTDNLDYVRLDQNRRMAYMQNDSLNSDKYAAVKLMNRSGDFSMKTFDNSVDLVNGFSETDKWAALSGGVESAILNDVDASIMVSIGSFDLAPHTQRRLGFFMFAANSLDQLTGTADAAQGLWDGIYPEEYANLDPVIAPLNMQLSQNYPNPFNPSTSIKYSLTAANHVNLTVYDVTGRVVRVLENRFSLAGQHTSIWFGDDDLGNQVPAGIYFCELEVGTESQSIKMLYLE